MTQNTNTGRAADGPDLGTGLTAPTGATREADASSPSSTIEPGKKRKKRGSRGGRRRRRKAGGQSAVAEGFPEEGGAPGEDLAYGDDHEDDRGEGAAPP